MPAHLQVKLEVGRLEDLKTQVLQAAWAQSLPRAAP